MKPEESAGCHQTLSSRVGYGFNHVNCRSCIFPLRTSNMSFVYKTLLLVIDSLVDVRVGQNMSRRTDHINSINSQQLVVDCGVYLYQYQCCNKNM